MGPSPGPERKAAQDNRAEDLWKSFHKRIEVKGDSESSYTDKELDNWLEGLSEDETEALGAKLRCLQYEYRFPRAMISVLEDVSYLVHTARWHLNRDGASPRWRAHIAVHMYEMRTLLQLALEEAAEIERSTGFSGERLSAE
jgi:hypothetical protein